jgi:hypothetical protein
MTLFAYFPKFLEIRLHPLLHPRLNNGPIRQNDKENILDCTFNRVRKANEPERYRLRPKFLSLQRTNLDVVKGRHEVCGDLGHFLLSYGIGRIVFTSLENVFERTAVFGRASVAEELKGECWGRQHEEDCEDQ